ncbi:MAG: response regulator [Saonia sp.]
MISGKLKILLIEDELSDYKLISHQINKIVEEPILVHVNTYTEFTSELKKFVPEVILCDYRLSGFNGMDVLNYTMENAPGTYLVFVTGTVNDEEIAANTILNGASGYILKKHMPVLHKKLLPHFEEIIKRRNKGKTSSDQREMFDTVQNFIENAMKENNLHIESYLQIKKSLAQLKGMKKDA